MGVVGVFVVEVEVVKSASFETASFSAEASSSSSSSSLSASTSWSVSRSSSRSRRAERSGGFWRVERERRLCCADGAGAVWVRAVVRERDMILVGMMSWV